MPVNLFACALGIGLVWLLNRSSREGRKLTEDELILIASKALGKVEVVSFDSPASPHDDPVLLKGEWHDRELYVGTESGGRRSHPQLFYKVYVPVAAVKHKLVILNPFTDTGFSGGTEGGASHLEIFERYFPRNSADKVLDDLKIGRSTRVELFSALPDVPKLTGGILLTTRIAGPGAAHVALHESLEAAVALADLIAEQNLRN